MRVLKTRRFRAGYEIRYEQHDADEFGTPEPFTVRSAYTSSGDYIGNPALAHRLIVGRGIRPERNGNEPEANSGRNLTCSIGFCAREQRWYGWSHRAMCSFGVGDTVKPGDLCATEGLIEEYLAAHPEKRTALPVGFTAATLDDARRMASAYAHAVS